MANNSFTVFQLIILAFCYGIAAQAGYETPSNKPTSSHPDHGNDVAPNPSYDSSAAGQLSNAEGSNNGEDSAISGLSTSQNGIAQSSNKADGLLHAPKLGGINGNKASISSSGAQINGEHEGDASLSGAGHSAGHQGNGGLIGAGHQGGQGDDGVNAFSNEDELARQRAFGLRTNKFPLPSCYINEDGFMCCNKELEKVMSGAYQKLSTSRPDWKKCNIAQVSVAVQQATERHFNVSFEVVAGAGDYASKNYFSQDLICKIKRDSSYILAFGTPQNS